MIASVDKPAHAERHRHRRRKSPEDFRRKRGDENTGVDTGAPDNRSKQELIKAAREKLELLRQKAGDANYYVAAIKQGMSGGKSFNVAYVNAAAAIRAEIAQIRRDLNAARSSIQDADAGGDMDTDHSHDHELHAIEDEAHQMERLSSFASARAGVHILHHTPELIDKLLFVLMPIEDDLKILIGRKHRYNDHHSLEAIEHELNTFQPEMEKLGARPVNQNHAAQVEGAEYAPDEHFATR